MSASDPFRVYGNIYQATHADVDRLVEYGKCFWIQTNYFAAGVSYDVPTITRITHQLVDEGVVLFAEDDEQNLLGLMLVIITPFLMNENFETACEWVFYVDPAYRGVGLGAVLIDEAEEILRMRGVKFFTLVSLANVTPKNAERLYGMLGYAHSETNFTKDLTWQP